MKSLFTIVDNIPYWVEDCGKTPNTIAEKPLGINTTLEVNPSSASFSECVTINTLKRAGLKTNKQLYAALLDKIKTEKITDMDSLANKYKIYIEYSMLENGNEVEHSVAIRPVEVTEAIIPLGVATNNECVFRRVKLFSPRLDFRLRNVVPFGIMGQRNNKYEFRIHTIALFQAYSDKSDFYGSTYDNPYQIGSDTINATVKDMLMVYSSENEGITIQDAKLNFMPRMVSLYINLVMTDYIVAYDSHEIVEAIQYNIEHKYDPDPEPDPDPDIPDPDGPLVPDIDTNPEADGKEEPDEDGYFNWYERCSPTTPNGKLVVENFMEANVYNPNKMVKQYKVIKDIPDIKVGEYVIWRESIITE